MLQSEPWLRDLQPVLSHPNLMLGLPNLWLNVADGGSIHSRVLLLQPNSQEGLERLLQLLLQQPQLPEGSYLALSQEGLLDPEDMWRLHH